jgi:hypothetical protein
MTLQLQFLAQNVNFALNILAALVMLMVAWLYFDAWLTKKTRKDTWKWFGFFVLMVSYLVEATLVERVDGVGAYYRTLAATLTELTRLSGFVLLVIGQLVDPLQPKPRSKGLQLEQKNTAPKFALLAPLWLGRIFEPIAALLASALYWRRATTGLESHLRSVARALFLLGVAEAMQLFAFVRESSSVNLAKFAAPFGPAWVIEHLFLAAGVFLLGRWVWQYLVTRLQSQLFMIINGVIAIVFLCVTTGFTFLLMQSTVSESLDNLNVVSRTATYSVETRKLETLAYADALASNEHIVGALVGGDFDDLTQQTKNYLAEHGQSSLVFTNADGDVVLRAEDPTRKSDTLSGDPIVRRALVGEKSSGIHVIDEAIIPLLQVRSVVPIVRNDTVVGTVGVGLNLSEEFVDGLKKVTGIEATLYAGTIRSATTLIGADGASRETGISEDNPKIQETVLIRGETFQGEIALLNSSYLAVFVPVKDIDGTVVGMLFAGKSKAALLAAAAQSTELSFAFVVVLLLVSIYPVFRISRFISRQIRSEE